MKKARREFDKEFKQMAVNLCLSGKSTREVADELGLRTELVTRWKREYNEYKEGSFSGHGNQNLTSEQKEIARLKRELHETQLERDILKKAVSIFSKGDNKYSGS
ncbi:transposase [Fulvivirga ligni]|uniref:transposase n=1 Tax=Fulvivirga ligni TaxID=2904246 RepID=UPI001F47A0C3|nr:transposase [Fulvivirga ligni]UII20268.1 transposase [Fulvivirga ligni]